MSSDINEIRNNAVHEKHTIFPIHASLRHGKAFDLFILWLGFNFQLITVTTGIIDTSPEGFNLSLGWAIAAILIGNILGGIFMALHSAQGAYLGISQMQQSRAQFGSFGILPILILVIIMYIGYYASILDVGEQALSSVINVKSSLFSSFIIIGLSVLSVIAAYIGYDLIHKYAKGIVIFGGATLTIILIYLLYLFINDKIDLAVHAVTLSGFFGAVGLSAIWQISYAPYVSDYSRYLPKDTGSKIAFWMTYLGSVTGACIAMFIGAVAGLTVFGLENGGYSFFTELFGIIGFIFILVWSISGVEAGAAQLYCSTLTGLSVVQTFISKAKFGRKSRFISILILSLIGTCIAIFASGSFMMEFTNFIYFLLYVLVPWSIINLVDYYLIHDGEYDLESLYRSDGSTKSYVNIRAVIAYIIGFIIEIPFMSNALFTGYISKMLGGADISWLVCSPFIAIIYYVLSKKEKGNTHLRLRSIFRGSSSTSG